MAAAARIDPGAPTHSEGEDASDPDLPPKSRAGGELPGIVRQPRGSGGIALPAAGAGSDVDLQLLAYRYGICLRVGRERFSDDDPEPIQRLPSERLHPISADQRNVQW